MSRIAGGPLVRAMLAESARGETWVQGDLGWVGTGAPNAHREDGLNVVVDGTVYAPVGRAGEPAAALVARLYREHGFAGALRRMNFDGAIALRDGDTLWLGRDRFGVRPLFHLADGSAFASRPRALLTLPGVSRAPRRSFVARFAASHYRTSTTTAPPRPMRRSTSCPADTSCGCIRGRRLCARRGGRSRRRPTSTARPTSSPSTTASCCSTRSASAWPRPAGPRSRCRAAWTPRRCWRARSRSAASASRRTRRSTRTRNTTSPTRSARCSTSP